MNFSKLLSFIFLFVFACISVTNGSLSGIRGKRQWGGGWGQPTETIETINGPGISETITDIQQGGTNTEIIQMNPTGGWGR
uniref:Uncharacterized protein n=1 Tax=Acrobeloides nanus TaxID=290746 RepID=A0A914EN89_9BILA